MDVIPAPYQVPGRLGQARNGKLEKTFVFIYIY